MSNIIGESELKQFVSNGEIIQNGDVGCAEGIKYDFCLGEKFIKTGFNSPKSYDYLLERDAAIIAPGEVVFVLTREYIDIPLDINIVLHEKRKLSQEGISLLGGRGVDPGYKGYLFFGLHNISSSPFPLKPGRKLIGATFYRLSDDEVVNPSKLPESWDDFPDDLERFVEKYKPVNPVAISTRLNELQKRLDDDKGALLSKMESLDNKVVSLDSKVEDKFKNFDDKMIDKMKNLDEKITIVDVRTRKMDETILSVKVWAKIIAGLLGIGIAVLAGVLTGVFSNIFGV
jgi:dUTPase